MGQITHDNGINLYQAALSSFVIEPLSQSKQGDPDTFFFTEQPLKEGG